MDNIITRTFRAAQAAVNELRKPSIQDISLAGATIAEQLEFEPYNPGDLVGKKGLKIYDKIRIDDTVKAGLLIKKYGRLSTDWYIESASDDNRDKEIADFVHFCLTDAMPGAFRKTLKEIYSALDYGYSITEKVYRPITEGQWRNKYAFKSLKTREPHDFNFILDKFGNLKKLKQSVMMDTQEFDPEDFIIFTYQKEFDNWYGRSDLRSCYRHWLSKDWILKFRSIALERYGMGVAIGKYPRTSLGERKQIQDILNKIQAKTAIVVPDDIVLEFLELSGRGYDAFNEAIKECNTSIMRSLLVPDLLGFSEFKTGSYALGKKHFDVFLMVLDELGEETRETIVGEQIIKPLIDYNYANITKYPQFTFAPLTEEDKFRLAELWTKATQTGYLTQEEDENYIRKLLGFPPKQQVHKQTYYADVYAKMNKYIKKVDFKKIKRQWDALEQNGIRELSSIVKKMRDKLLSTIDKHQIVENKNSKEVEKLQIFYVGDFKDTIFNAMGTGYLGAKNDALQELRRAGLTHKFQIDEPLPPEEALKAFEGLPVKLKSELKYFRNKAFTIARIESEKILNEAKLIIYEGIRNKAPAQTKRRLKMLFEKYILTTDVKTGELLKEYRLETIIRTNVADAINQGRKAMFDDEEVQGFIVAYTTSSVLDDSTTDFCSMIDGRIWSQETFMFPPYHYDCRTIAVAITRAEIEGEELSGLEEFPAGDIPGF